MQKENGDGGKEKRRILFYGKCNDNKKASN